MLNARPHVAISAHLLHGASGYRSAGIHTYIAHLLEQISQVDSGLRYTIYTNAHLASDIQVRSTRWPTDRPLARIVWEQLAQPFVLRRDQPDLLHASAFVAPFFAGRPKVITVYDLSFKLFPEYFRGPNQTYLRMFTQLSLKRATRVIAISNHTRDDVHRLYNVPLDRIDVAAPGVSTRFRPLSREVVEAFRRDKQLPERFFLYVGTLEPRKNLDRLIDAFAQLTDQTARLIFVGGKGWMVDSLFAKVKSLGLSDHIAFAGYAPDEDLPLWYNAATAFVYPSTYEGFGIPPLEALACGTATIVSHASSLPQAVGDAALLVDPHDVQAISEALARLWDDAALRAELAQRGIAHARQFTWQATAQATVASYRRALETRSN